jgi:NAD(P)-dependent dehydrogenase (short-subunit alcohol dehydrogenase family)
MTEPRAVLVTGCSSGIGLETALHLAQHGFRVFASMRDLDRRGALDDEAARRGLAVEVLQLDVTDAASVASAVSTLIRRAGGIYGLVNNAGVQLRGYFEDLSPSEIERVFETNLFGVMAVTRAVLPHLRRAGRGRIVMVGSMGGRIASPACSAYCASKSALEGFSESLALEVKLLGAEVVVVEPGLVKTDRFWTANRGVARAALDPESPYHRWFARLERLADQLAAAAPVRPVDVAQAVYQALTARSPRLRYVVGRRARLLLRLRAYLPGESFERLALAAVTRRLVRAREA